MNDLELIEYQKRDLSNSMLVVTFPTVGLISSIAGHFIIDSLQLNEIGTILSDSFMPAAIIHKSRPSPPVRIYAGEKKCGPDGTCDQITVIISDFMPSYNIIRPLAKHILQWAENKGIETIVTLEGTHATGKKRKNDKEYQVYGIASNQEIKTLLKKYNIEETKEGMITGVTGVLLYESYLQKHDLICLLSEAHSAFPDSRAAANLLKKLDVMLPGIKIDPEPLYKEADEIEKNIRKFMKQSKPTAPQLPPSEQQMYV